MLEANQICIIGTGLLGGSIGLGLRSSGFAGKIVGLGRRIETVENARQRGCVDQALGLEALPRVLPASQLVVLASPISTFPALLQAVAAGDHADLAVTDAGSTKQWVCAQARQILPAPQRFVGSHPMAGGEQHGPQRARPDLFTGKPCILTPEAETDARIQQRVESLWQTLGMRIVRLGAAEHDAQAARISHLPHALAVLLVQLAARDGGLEIASTGFRDTTRVASSDAVVWTDIFATNGPAVVAAIDALQRDLEQFKTLLTNGQREQLTILLQSSRASRDQWRQLVADPPGAAPSSGE